MLLQAERIRRMWTSIWQRSKIGHNVAFLTMGRCYMGILKRNIKKIVIIGLFLIDGWGFSTDYNDYLSVTNDQSRSVFGQVQTGKDANQTEKTSGRQSGTANATGSFPGFLKGAISDNSSSDTLAGASVILTLSGRTVSSSTTGDDGTYFFQVPPGSYSIDVSKGGFNSKREPNVSINAFETVTRSISLSKVAVATPTPSPTVTPQPTECEDGGVPSDLNVVPGSLTIRSGKSKKVKVYVKKDKRKGCAIEVKIDCIEGCGKIKLSDNIVTTNQRGNAKVKIKAEKQGKGSAKIVFSVGGLTTELPIVIK